MKSSAFASGKECGFSLVELMVSITIGLIILAAVATIMVSSKTTYTTQDRAARVQENGRTAMQFLVRDLRLTAYYGCSDIADSTIAVTSSLDPNPVRFSFNTQMPVEGLNNATGPWISSAAAALPAGMAAGTDAITIRMLEPSATNTIITAEMPTPAALINVNQTTGLLQNDIVMLGDCSGADIFQITNIDTAANTLEHAVTGTGENITASLSKRYKPPAEVMRFFTRTYFIRNGASGNRALFRTTNTGGAEEIVDGIESLQILYGVNTETTFLTGGQDTNGDGAPDVMAPNVYLPAHLVGTAVAGISATENWRRVVSVRIGILATALNQLDAEVDTTPAGYDIDGDGASDFFPAANDRNRRKIFQSTVALRNRQSFL
jgi:type IV pilus assembly protein PilW